MARSKIKAWSSIRTKVLGPVIFVMILVLAVSMTLVEKRSRSLLEHDAQNTIKSKNTSFRSVIESTEEHRKDAFKLVLNEPKIKSVVSVLGDSTGRGSGPRRTSRDAANPEIARTTLLQVLDDMVKDGDADFVYLAVDPAHTKVSLHSANPAVQIKEVQAATTHFVEMALQENPVPTSYTIAKLGEDLYDVVTMPIKLDANDAFPLGSITFGVTNRLKEEFIRLVNPSLGAGGQRQGELVLIQNGRIIATTLADPAANEVVLRESVAWSRALPTTGADQLVTKTMVIGDRHYSVCFDQIKDSRQEPIIDYVILGSDYEGALEQLRGTQRLIFLSSLLAIVVGSVIVWLVVRKATKPLNELRESAEAVGAGDYTRRVPARTRDEFGELALGFNQMTENIQASRQQLEATVERLKTTQAQLVQSEKLSGIGEFVAGVAHELNNPLTTVMGFSELLQQDRLDPKHQEFVNLIHKNAQRCQRIVQSLLSFARRHQPERKPANVNEIIQSSLDILQYQLRTSNIELKLKLDPNLPLALVDSHQIQQVVVNIINNGRQAIESTSPGGTIHVTTERAGANVRVVIEDSGPGISAENLSKIFDPFFTTKEVGKGTGLGLSLCYGIIKEHGGTIVPSCRPGCGATFTIELPLAENGSGAMSPLPKSAIPVASMSNEGEGKRVLVIDDEEPILQMVREALTRHGYAVDIANNGETGLSRLRQNRYDITLCDMKMPGLTGQQVYERLRDQDPILAARLIFVTGDLVNEKTREFLDAEKKLCLPKPFTLAEFRAAINQVVSN